VYKDIKRAAKALRLDANVAPHSLRKCYAVEIYRKSGLEATRKALNHSDSTVTLIYILSELVKVKE
jgi:site-specific recombinase XerC